MDYIIVQAGGKGSRLGYLTENKPKALVPIANLPMLFYLFRKFPEKRFVIIADYKKDVLRQYLSCFAEVKYQIVEAKGTGTCSGITQALSLIPKEKSFMLIWSDLILPSDLELPAVYEKDEAFVRQTIQNDYIGISTTFPCRWCYENGKFTEKKSHKNGVAGMFLFTDKSKLEQVPESGELVRWMQQNEKVFQEFNLTGAQEFGVLEEYKKLALEKCRPFNRITIEGDIFIKEAVDEQGRNLAVRECAWYEKTKEKKIDIIPQIYSTNPLKMEYIKGKNIYQCQLTYEEKKKILWKLVDALQRLHRSEEIPSDFFSIKEAYYNKTMKRLAKIQDLVPFAKEKSILINGKVCRNVFFYKRELETKLEQLRCDKFCFIHGDCTFSNLMLRDDGRPVLIDPRGYFGYTDFYGDPRYDWAKLYYSIVGNYDRFNLKEFSLKIADDRVVLQVNSNNWQDMEGDFFDMTRTDPYEIRLLHSIIWLSLTTYTWQDYDSICGAFYNGLYYLEDLY